MAFEPTLEQTKAILKTNKSVTKWHKAFLKYFPKYGITTPLRVAGFLAQCGHESNDFKIVEENLNYSATGLNKTFSKYFIRAGRDAKEYAYQPEKIANVVYANRMGNGPTSSGDGYRFRGRGPIQLTGRNNYTNFGKTIGKSAEEVVEYMETLEGKLEAALWFWKENNLNAYCDNGDIVGMTKRINGGTNGLEDRKRRWVHALSVFNNPPVHALSVFNNPPVTGKEKTKLVPKTVSGRTLRKGASGGQVRELQVLLGVTADGKFGPATEAAVKRYQKKHGLVVDGIVGRKTAAKMGLQNGW